MNAKKMAKILKEIEDSSILVEYFEAIGIDLSQCCGCFNRSCLTCNINDDTLFSEKKVKEARAWKDGD